MKKPFLFTIFITTIISGSPSSFAQNLYCAKELNKEEQRTLDQSKQVELDIAKENYKEAQSQASDEDEQFFIKMNYLRQTHNIKNEFQLKQLEKEFDRNFVREKVLPELAVKIYRELRVLSHCALVSKSQHDQEMPFYQLELANAMAFWKRPELEYNPMGWKIALYGMQIGKKPNIEVFEFYKEDKRALYDKHDPPTGDDPICVKPGTKKLPTSEYRKCFQQYVRNYAANQGDEIRQYIPMRYNCCHFAEEVLDACGLKTCFTLPKRSAPTHKKGTLEYQKEKQCKKTAY